MREILHFFVGKDAKVSDEAVALALEAFQKHSQVSCLERVVETWLRRCKSRVIPLGGVGRLPT